MRSDGYISFTVICLILFISTLIILGSTFILNSYRELNELKTSTAMNEHLHKKVQTIIEVLLKEKQADSEYNDVWDHVESLSDGTYSFTLTEISSRINPNFDSTDLWRKTSLKEKIVNQSLVDQWNQERIEDFADTGDSLYNYFPEEHWESIYTLYSFINVRTCPEEVINAYLIQNNYDASEAQSIVKKISTYNDNKEKIPQAELNTLLKRDDLPYSLMLTSAAQINVNFCDPAVLEAILSYPWLGQPLGNAHIIKNNIINARSRSEIDSNSLKTLLECDEEVKNELLKYLGTTSWFWKLKIKGKHDTWEYIFCRIPPIEEDKFPKSIQIVSKIKVPKESDET